MPISLRPIPEPSAKDCPKCWQATGGQGVPLVRGQYTGQTVAGNVTLRPAGPGFIGRCMKCPLCGYSRHLMEDES